MKSAMETVDRIEPALLEDAPVEITDVIAELSAKAAILGSALHPKTASNLADLVRIMNTYYSNLIEGHHTRPRDIERALSGELDQDIERRDLQPDQLAERGIDGALAGQRGAKRGERLEHGGVLRVGADARRGYGLALGLLAEVPDLVVNLMNAQWLDSRHQTLLTPAARRRSPPR